METKDKPKIMVDGVEYVVTDFWGDWLQGCTPKQAVRDFDDRQYAFECLLLEKLTLATKEPSTLLRGDGYKVLKEFAPLIIGLALRGLGVGHHEADTMSESGELTIGLLLSGIQCEKKTIQKEFDSLYPVPRLSDSFHAQQVRWLYSNLV